MSNNNLFLDSFSTPETVIVEADDEDSWHDILDIFKHGKEYDDFSQTGNGDESLIADIHQNVYIPELEETVETSTSFDSEEFYSFYQGTGVNLNKTDNPQNHQYTDRLAGSDLDLRCARIFENYAIMVQQGQIEGDTYLVSDIASLEGHREPSQISTYSMELERRFKTENTNLIFIDYSTEGLNNVKGARREELNDWNN